MLLYLKPCLLFVSLCNIVLRDACLLSQNHVSPSLSSSPPAVCRYFCVFWVINSSCTFQQAEFLWSSLYFAWKNRLASHKSTVVKHDCNSNWCVWSRVMIASKAFWYLKTIIAICFTINLAPYCSKVNDSALLLFKLKPDLVFSHGLNTHYLSFCHICRTLTVLSIQQCFTFMW